MTTATKTPLLAFHNDPAIKKKYLARVRKHREADQLIQGYGYWKDGKGCAVGPSRQSAYILMQHRPRVVGGTIPMIVFLDGHIALQWMAREQSEHFDNLSIVVAPLNTETL